MKAIKITMAIVLLATGTIANAQTKRSVSEVEKIESSAPNATSIDDKFAAQLEVVQALTNRMQTEGYSDELQKQIEVAQSKLVALQNEAKSVRNAKAAEANKRNRPMDILVFNPDESSLRIKGFTYTYEPVQGLLRVQFETKTKGPLEASLVTPGSLVAAKVMADCEGGPVEISFDLSETGATQLYFHLVVDGKKTTESIEI